MKRLGRLQGSGALLKRMRGKTSNDEEEDRCLRLNFCVQHFGDPHRLTLDSQCEIQSYKMSCVIRYTDCGQLSNVSINDRSQLSKFKIMCSPGKLCKL